MSWLEKYMDGLLGNTIIETGVDDEGFPYFIISDGTNEFRVQVSCDEEGNGPGFLVGVPEVAPAIEEEDDE